MKNRNLSHRNDWKTPDDLFSSLDMEFCFDFDPCPIDPKFDGLSVEWGESSFVNPPYSRKLKEAFVEKALTESKKGKLCVLLLPVSTSTKLFHEVILPNASDLRFLRGRPRFLGYDSNGNWVENRVGQHDSMVVVFDGRQ